MGSEEFDDCYRTGSLLRLVTPDARFEKPFLLTNENLGTLYRDIDAKFKTLSTQVLNEIKSGFYNRHFTLVVILEPVKDENLTGLHIRVSHVHALDAPDDFARHHQNDYRLMFEWYDPENPQQNRRPPQWLFVETTYWTAYTLPLVSSPIEIDGMEFLN